MFWEEEKKMARSEGGRQAGRSEGGKQSGCREGGRQTGPLRKDGR